MLDISCNYNKLKFSERFIYMFNQTNNLKYLLYNKAYKAVDCNWSRKL